MPLSQIQPRIHRSLQLVLFAASITWVIAATVLASRAARGLSVRFQLSDEFLLIDSIFLVFLLALGFVVLQGIAVRDSPLRRTVGLPKRPSSGAEWATGAAIGWAVILLGVLAMAAAATLHIRFWFAPRSFWLVATNLAAITLLSLASEIAFRGYPFHRLIDAVGAGWATMVMTLLYGMASTMGQDSTYLSTSIGILVGLLLCLAWLRTHGLWLGWGLHFAWIASLGVLFGLPVTGFDNFSSAVQTRAIGARWITGGGLGPEGALLTLPLLVAAIVVLIRVTRDWAWDYARKPLVPAGYPMDVPPPAAHTAMETQVASAPALVQIQPTTPQTRSAEVEDESLLDSAFFGRLRPYLIPG